MAIDVSEKMAIAIKSTSESSEVSFSFIGMLLTFKSANSPRSSHPVKPAT